MANNKHHDQENRSTNRSNEPGEDIEFSEELADHEDHEAQQRAREANRRVEKKDT
ncbi:YfhD family protein [Texcoconibacillus texcoconensis]|uniref:YfhD family protein n=1 Tax=Texcoconibacillus texcoconensis TaxID=1095777 RepID=A0A840QTL3_9BACI|nr:YfhD family protein [Texcoconibacillus texcoconensis]MBB5174639.1 hypothetical protein [Texcoconibacillus texcoconensis]